MRNLAITGTGLLMLGVAACAHVADQPYAPPSSGQTATLVVVNRTPSQVYPFLYGDAAECRHRSKLPPVFTEAESGPVAIPAGRDLAITVRHDPNRVTPDLYCDFTVSFPVEAGRTYVVGLRFENYRCLVEVLDATSGLDRARWVRVPARARELHMAWDNRGPFCDKE